jgi:uncharacterized membrane protein
MGTTSNFGEIAAFLSAVFWTISALLFKSAGQKTGDVNLTIVRLFLGFIFLSVFITFYRGMPFPTDATAEQWFWLSLSGIVGFVLSDLFLFKAYTLIGFRNSMLIMTLMPAITALFGRLFLNETLSLMNKLGMLLTIIGVALAILKREKKDKHISVKSSIKGMLFAFVGTIGQAGCLILSKLGMSNNYNPFAAAQIRIITGLIGFMILISLTKRWKYVYTAAITTIKAKKTIILESIFGPFLGVSFSLLAIQYTKTGIASSIMSIVPVLLIGPVIFLYKQKTAVIEAIGAIISLVGISLFFSA